MNIPKGYKLVPVEPTEEMRKAIYGLLSAYDDGSDITPAFFMKMLINAAPAPPQHIYDEAKERELFEEKFPVMPGILWDEDRKQYYGHSLYWLQQAQLDVWLACAKSRAKAGEVGHE